MRDVEKSTRLPDWAPYVVPIALFLGITYVEGESPANYVWIYFAKIAIVIAALIWAKPTWRDLKWEPGLILPAVAIGLALFVVWVGIESRIVYPHLGDRSAYDPWKEIADPGLRMAFIATRFLGLVLVVPFMEELFWRSFALRFATKPDFQSLPIGTFSLGAAALVCVVFAGAHPEWIPALIFAVAMTLLVWKTRSISACFIAHAVTNLALGIYVVNQGAWALW